MNFAMPNYNLNKTKLLITFGAILVFVITIFITVVQVQKQQNTKSKASSQNTYNALDVTDAANNALQFKDDNGIRIYETQSLNVKVKINDLEKLIGE